jgi:hypothetical protein
VRPPIVLAPGQVWRAPDGTTRTVLRVYPATTAARALVRVKVGVRATTTIEQISMRGWIVRVQAVEDVSDAG